MFSIFAGGMNVKEENYNNAAARSNLTGKVFRTAVLDAYAQILVRCLVW